MQKHRPVMLVILDGERREDPTDNAVRQARTPFFNELWAHARMLFCAPALPSHDFQQRK